MLGARERRTQGSDARGGEAVVARELIDVALLTSDELAWLNAYHAEVADKIGPALDGEDRAWLIGKCAPLEAA